MPHHIGRDYLRSALSVGAVTVVDALPAHAYANRHLPSAVNLTAEDAAARAPSVLPDRAADIVVYSTDAHCTRGPDLAAALEQLGYTNISVYTEGIQPWADAGLPVEHAIT
ncbi:rhodanese-like domain-containing protein [Actinoplanes sp. NPDC051470]|uniref:rhodanese-like domain-containing protein n=1 Tax=unclassified Actinoplanes TaxID=2626549 RepID=UPI0034373935